MTELLPTFIQGWYLLADAGLDHNEKNLVMTALGGNFQPDRVAQELRNQFPESEVRRRDGQRRFQSYLGETFGGSEEDEETSFGLTPHELIEDGFDDEDLALVADAEDQAQSAMAAMNQARRTLREARHKQQLVKQSRKYYVNSTSSRSSSSQGGKPRDDSNLDCLRCGQRGHRAANCPHKPIAAQAEATKPGAGEWRP